jgi:ubiquinone/menaquinone biosynthesis C-methylase UbiE
MVGSTRKPKQNPFDDSDIAQGYEGWFETPMGRMVDREEIALLRSMLPEGDGKTFLDIGCGSGHFSRVLASHGYTVFGSDISAAMLKEARRRSGGRYFLCDAHRLPHVDRSIDTAGTFTVLEFVEDPRRVVAEMIRVARENVLIAFLNKWGGMNMKRVTMNLLGKKDVFSGARFFGVGSMKRLVREAAEFNKRTIRIQWGSAVGPAVLKRLFSRSRLGDFIIFVVQLDDLRS